MLRVSGSQTFLNCLSQTLATKRLYNHFADFDTVCNGREIVDQANNRYWRLQSADLFEQFDPISIWAYVNQHRRVS